MIHIKYCGICKRRFETTQWNAGFCSDECREVNRKAYAYKYNKVHYEPVLVRKKPEAYSTKNAWSIVHDPTGCFRKGSRLLAFLDTLAKNTDDEQYIPYGTIVKNVQTGELKKVHGKRLRKVR